MIYQIIEFIRYLEGVLDIEILKHADDKFDRKIKKIFKKIEEKFKKVEETEKVCPKCGSKLVVREGKRGLFYGCSNFPQCKYTENYTNQKYDTH